MFIEDMTKKEKIETLKRELNGASIEILDMMLLDFGYEYSEEEEE